MAGRLASTSDVWTPIDISAFVREGSSDEELDQVAREVSHAFETKGFLLISDHGVDAGIVAAVETAALAFFALPDDVKKECFLNRAPVPRGYSACGKENFAILSLKNQRKPNDLVEKFRMGPLQVDATDDYFTASKDAQMMFYPNKWPSPDDMLLQDAMERYYLAMDALSAVLLRIFARCLDLPQNFFAAKMTRHTSIFSVNYYPAMDQVRQQIQPGQLRLAQHTDVDLFTIVRPDMADAFGCLQIEVASDTGSTWLSVPAVPDTFIVNLGDCLKYWTNDRWMSTSHRVVNPPVDSPTTSRISMAYFVGANYDATLDCLPTCCVDGCRHHGDSLKTYVEWRKGRVRQAMEQLKSTPVSTKKPHMAR
ncbi:hypothetical protein DYB32_009654 [Aphanomyces invadans]|uniref:Fe2OG dioxygenase domain-containing protein n=1 Tax=Aphanomyces invadans TaxID=157072 RepID=A0A418AK24_9STRA|nr:hypothetical protein DYB32_009654 [Aphanomyces invadans]